MPARATDATPQAQPPTNLLVEFRKLKVALVDQLPGPAVTSWWRRVRQAAKAGSTDALALLKAEAQARLEHERRRQQQAVLDVLFDALARLVAELFGTPRKRA